MPARLAPELTLIAFAAPVNWVLLLDEVVGPVTVLEAELEADVTVPLLDEVDPPVGPTLDVEQEVVVRMVVVMVEVAPEGEEEAVVVAEAEEVDVVETEAVVELAAALEEDGVQPGRVNVPL